METYKPKTFYGQLRASLNSDCGTIVLAMAVVPAEPMDVETKSATDLARAWEGVPALRRRAQSLQLDP